MDVCLFNLSKYEVSLFHLYIAFLTITASSSYNKNNDMIMSETSSLLGC